MAECLLKEWQLIDQQEQMFLVGCQYLMDCWILGWGQVPEQEVGQPYLKSTLHDQKLMMQAGPMQLLSMQLLLKDLKQQFQVK